MDWFLAALLGSESSGLLSESLPGFLGRAMHVSIFGSRSDQPANFYKTEKAEEGEFRFDSVHIAKSD